STPGSTNPRFRAVSCVALSSCTAVGYGSASVENSYSALVETWDGTTWTVQSNPFGSISAGWYALYAVSCSSSSFCDAVGPGSRAAGATAPSYPVAEAWEGTSWSTQAAPGFGTAETFPEGVSCPASAS